MLEKRKVLLPIFLALIVSLISIVSAYTRYGGYRTFSISDFLNNIGSDNIILGSIFLLSFIFSSFSLKKVLKGEEKSANAAALILALLITYGVNQSGFNYEYFFYDIMDFIGFNPEIMVFIIAAAFIGLLVLFGSKVGWGLGTLALGLVMIGFGLISDQSDLSLFGLAVGFFGVLILLVTKRNRPQATTK